MKIAFCGHFYPKRHKSHFSSTPSVSSFGIHSYLISPVFYIKRRPNIFRFLSKYIRSHIKRNKYLAFIRHCSPILPIYNVFTHFAHIYYLEYCRNNIISVKKGDSDL